MKPHKLSDNQLRIVITELITEQESFSVEEAEQRFRSSFPMEPARLDESDGHSLHETIGGRIYDYSKWSASKRLGYRPTPPRIERDGDARWRAKAE